MRLAQVSWANENKGRNYADLLDSTCNLPSNENNLKYFHNFLHLVLPIGFLNLFQQSETENDSPKIIS